MSNMCTWLKVYTALVHLMVYQISKICLYFMHMQHKHMVYSELHIDQYLVLDQTANVNAYSTPLRHEVWNVDHKMVIMGIDFCYNTFSHLGVQHNNYPKHNTPYRP